MRMRSELARGRSRRSPCPRRGSPLFPRGRRSIGHAGGTCACSRFTLPCGLFEPHPPTILTHHSPQLPSRTPSTHTPWSGRGSWRPGGAPRWTNDLDAMGRVCSALPGSMAYGKGALHARPYVPAGGYGAPCSRCRPIPRRRLSWPWAALCGDRLMASGPIHVWARASAQRGRSGPAGHHACPHPFPHRPLWAAPYPGRSRLAAARIEPGSRGDRGSPASGTADAGHGVPRALPRNRVPGGGAGRSHHRLVPERVQHPRSRRRHLLRPCCQPLRLHLAVERAWPRGGRA